MRQSLESMLAEMPHLSGAPLKPDAAHDSINLAAELPHGYVWPDVKLDQVKSCPVALLTAPGAMGKSAAAHAIASTLRCPYMDLGRMQVGSSTVTGELAKALGFSQAAVFVEALKLGTASLVLDSTDEAQLSAGRENFLAFLSDLAWIMSDAKAGGQVILLGRRDAIETTYLNLLDLGFDAPIIEIAPLSHRQASDLVGETLDRKMVDDRPYRVHKEHPEPFAKLRDSAFAEIGAALDLSVNGINDWGKVEGFLGYPPVVMALAERLAVDNPQTELRSRGGAGLKASDRMRQGQLLRRVVEDILDREAGKVRKRLGERMGLPEGDPRKSLLYTADEQVARLLASVGTSTIEVPLPAALLPHERATYEDSIGSFVLDHPFLYGAGFANVVFSDYVRAHAVSSPVYGVQISSRPAFLSGLPKVGPFFTHFLHSMNATPSGFTSMPEDLVDDALHSYQLGAENGSVAFTQQRERAVLVLKEREDSYDPISTLIFDVENLSGALQVSGPLARFACVTEAGVILVGPNGHLDIGPGVFIAADTLVIKASSVVGVSSEPGLSALLSANSVDHDPQVKVLAYPERSLIVSWPEPWHQWQPFHREIARGRSNVGHLLSAQILAGIRRILLVFGASMRDDPSVYVEKLERVTIGNNQVFAAVFAALLDLGIVERDGALYRSRVARLAEYGVSWSSLRGDDPVGQLTDLHAEIVDHPALTEVRAQEA